jgi:AcrR family transcriptional regulator
MIPAEVVAFRSEVSSADGLRSRKKQQTRHAIEDAARDLFADQGYDATTVEQIAERADVAVSTFFRYFPTKREAILSDQSERLPALQQAIVDRPADESDLVALHAALQQEWVAAIDPERTARTAAAIELSHVLLGVAFEVGHTWLVAISEALAQRKKLAEVDERCELTATTALAIWRIAVEEWRRGGCRGDLADDLERGFAMMGELCAEWSNAF